MYKSFLFLVLLVSIFSCTEEVEPQKNYFEKSDVEQFDPIEVLFDEDTFDNPKDTSTDTVGFPVTPRFVLIMTTPFDPREP